MIRLSSFLLLCFFTLQLAAQNKSMPSVEVKDAEGKTINLSSLAGDGKIRVFSFWATWCSPCKKELDAIHEFYEEWQTKYNVELVAVSVDDARTMPKARTMVEEKGWLYRILFDSTKALQNAAGVASVPYTFLVDEKGNIVYEHTGYAPGDELELEEKIKELANR
jgi:cytochrome c biogenesis protein CcmG, thiol:disulfide interchange protein DsbE